MPLYADRVANALHVKLHAFNQVEQKIQADLQALLAALEQFNGMSAADINAAIALVDRSGAKPTVELDAVPPISRFGKHWEHHQEARAWAAEVLNGVTTFAVDGSQIPPSRDLSIPVGLVQIGWFENPHSPAGDYVKDISVEVLSPDDLINGEHGLEEQEVEWRRFQGEFNHAIAFMQAHKKKSALAFIDGPLVVSFIGKYPPQRQRQYIRMVEDLLMCSEETQVPVVGFIDNSYATDLTTLIMHINGYTGRPQVSDAILLRDAMQWGDRNRLYVCSRDDGIPKTDYYEQVCFSYLKTTSENPPARIELPCWVLDHECHNWVFDVIRAECVVGLGYPYPLETADAVAVLSIEDRERFYQLFQQFAIEQTLPLRFSRKSTSKRSRRL